MHSSCLDCYCYAFMLLLGITTIMRVGGECPPALPVPTPQAVMHVSMSHQTTCRRCAPLAKSQLTIFLSRHNTFFFSCISHVRTLTDEH